MTNIDDPKRIQFEVQKEVKERLVKKLRWGQLTMVYEALTLDLLDLVENHDPYMVVAAIVSKELTLHDIIKKRNGGHKQSEKESDGNDHRGHQ